VITIGSLGRFFCSLLSLGAVSALLLAGCATVNGTVEQAGGAIRNQGITVKLVIINIPIGPPCPDTGEQFADPEDDSMGHSNRRGPPP